MSSTHALDRIHLPKNIGSLVLGPVIDGARNLARKVGARTRTFAKAQVQQANHIEASLNAGWSRDARRGFQRLI